MRPPIEDRKRVPPPPPKTTTKSGILSTPSSTWGETKGPCDRTSQKPLVGDRKPTSSTTVGLSPSRQNYDGNYNRQTDHPRNNEMDQTAGHYASRSDRGNQRQCDFYHEDRRGYNEDRRGYNEDRRGYNEDRRGYNEDRRGYNEDRRGYNEDRRGYNEDRRGYNEDRGGYSSSNDRGFNERGNQSHRYSYEDRGGYYERGNDRSSLHAHWAGHSNVSPNTGIHLWGEPSPPSLPPKHVVEQTTPSSPQKYVVQQMRPHAPSTSPQKHVIDLSSATTTDSNKKRKESYYDVSYSPVFRDVEKKAKTGVEHSLCFNPKYRALLSNASKSAHPPRPFTLLGRIEFPFPPLFRPLRSLPAIPDQKNVSGKRWFISVDQHGLEFRLLDGCRIGPPLSTPNVPRTKFKYFDHAAWFIECANLNTLSKKCFGLALAVITNDSKVELGFSICVNRDHFIYALFTEKMMRDPITGLPLPSYMMLTEEYCNLTVNFETILGGVFSGPFRMHPDDFVNPKCKKRVIFLNQVAGRAISELQDDPTHKNKVQLCRNHVDGGFQCAHTGPSYLIPPRWRFPFQGEQSFIKATNEARGPIELVRPQYSSYESKHTFYHSRYKASHSTCNFHGAVSMDDHCNSLYVLKDSRPSSRVKGPTILLEEGGGGKEQEPHTTSMHCFYLPYLQAESQDCVSFAMITREDFVTFFTIDEVTHGMDVSSYNDTLKNVSKADICLAVIDPLDHPGGFQICLADPNDNEEMQQFENLTVLVDTMYGSDDSSAEPYTHQDLKRVDKQKNGKLVWTNNYTLPWLTVFRSFPWTRETGLTTKDSDIFLDAYGSAFSNRKSVTHYGQTVYQGLRGTKAVRLSPTQGPGEGDKQQYYRETSYVPALIPTAEKIGNKLFSSSSQRMRWLDPAIDSLLKIWMNGPTIERNHYCRAKIIAHGVPTCRKRALGVLKDGLGPCLGWASTEHCDSGDVLDPVTQTKLTDSLQSWEPKQSSVFNQESAVKQYLLKFGRTLRFGVPTCCGYEYLGMEEDGTTILTHRNIFTLKTAIIHHYFVMTGLRCTSRLRHQYGTHFYAFVFAHCTSLCVATFDGKVYFTDNRFRTFSWGGAGS
jgi:hypothetical protein